ncbi:hypothetical protein KVR01_002775 [Diaporthe batatas]|uniref:uncharacterized protein n=1 Tax=Diaporthe batatas TaxID=748121 RepID=UPI001D04CFBF|nr:uncharacterized protein KVR01_002775 [Diaporthe batatas]KAG8167086.1 hypothetical protein KVR01_002775 [Diaporthe batatas]
MDDHTVLVGRHDEHLERLPLTTISILAPFSALIMSIIFVIYFIIRFYLLEGYLLKRIYGATYTIMDETTRRGFVNHHIAGGTKILILIAAIYPFISVVFGTSDFHTRFSKSSPVTMGDILVVVSQMLMAMYIFELFYRPKISPVSVGHHVGTIMIGQSAIAISLEIISEPDADIEFSLCLVWGAFDIISEFLPHVTIILYRVYPQSHAFLRKLFLAAMATTLTGTITETILTMYMFGSLWNKWTLAFKITTPMLHVLFAAAQLWGSWNFYCLYQRQCRLLVAGREPDTNTAEDAKPAADKSTSSEPLGVLPEDLPQRLSV